MKPWILCTISLIVGIASSAAELRIGIIGCDTSHVTAFTDALNNPEAKGHVPGGKVVGAFKGGSPDVPASANRIEGYVKTLQEKYGVKFYDRIEDLCTNVDALLLESLDGRPHVEQFRAITNAIGTTGTPKPVFIDKPMAASLHDVIEIFGMARRVGIPVFSSSALRFAKDTQAAKRGSLGNIAYVETYGPCELEPHHPDLFWYGVHGVEAIYTMMGTGCETVQRSTNSAGRIEVTGLWSRGRRGVFREDKGFGGLARGEKGEAAAGSFDGYVPLLVEIMRFFQTGVAPVKAEETIEIFAFMEAADASKANGGAPAKISDTIERAKH